MDRRQFLTVALSAPFAALAAQPGALVRLEQVPAWLDALARGRSRSTGPWPLGAVLTHLAQSIEYSLDGFPEAKGALFQHTLGALAFAVFKQRGRMSHDLAAPIPGAPALPAEADWQGGAQRLRDAVMRFTTHRGPLRPHFAYGDLDRADYAIAHLLHIENHRDEIVAE